MDVWLLWKKDIDAHTVAKLPCTKPQPEMKHKRLVISGELCGAVMFGGDVRPVSSASLRGCERSGASCRLRLLRMRG